MRPLNNVKVVVTRAQQQAGDFASLLENEGAKIIYFPTIEFKEPDDMSVIDNAIDNLESYDWIIFTSVNAVRFFFRRMRVFLKNVTDIKNMKIGVIGPRTADVLKKMGVNIDIVPDEYRAEGLINNLLKVGVSGKKVLIPRALIGREIIPDTLSDNGADVVVAPVYFTKPPNGLDAATLLNAFANNSKIILTFTSGSTVKNFFAIFSDEQLETFIDKVKIAALSPVTGEVLERLGHSVDIMPESYTSKDLAEAIVECCRN